VNATALAATALALLLQRRELQLQREEATAARQEREKERAKRDAADALAAKTQEIASAIQLASARVAVLSSVTSDAFPHGAFDVMTHLRNALTAGTSTANATPRLRPMVDVMLTLDRLERQMADARSATQAGDPSS